MYACAWSSEEERCGDDPPHDDGAVADVTALHAVLRRLRDKKLLGSCVLGEGWRAEAPAIVDACRAAWPPAKATRRQAAVTAALDTWAASTMNVVCLACGDARLHEWTRDFFTSCSAMDLGVAVEVARDPPSCPNPCERAAHPIRRPSAEDSDPRARAVGSIARRASAGAEEDAGASQAPSVFETALEALADPATLEEYFRALAPRTARLRTELASGGSAGTALQSLVSGEFGVRVYDPSTLRRLVSGEFGVRVYDPSTLQCLVSGEFGVPV
jgi:hypothetical protein